MSKLNNQERSRLIPDTVERLTEGLLAVLIVSLVILLAQFPVHSTPFLALSVMIAVLLSGYSVYRVLKSTMKRLEKLANKDILTGLYNPQVINKLLHYDIERSKRYHQDLSVILLDIDDFAPVTHAYGQNQCDRVIRSLSKIILDGVEYIDQKKKEFHGIRTSDIAFRYGGEGKILIIMPVTNAKGAYVAAERIREAIMYTPFEITDKTHNKNIHLRITLSAGVASFNSKNDTAQTLLQRADLQLCKAQITRNHVAIENPVHYDETTCPVVVTSQEQGN